MTENEIMRIYTEATRFAHDNHQTIGEDNDYCITLAQLEYLLSKFPPESIY